MGNLKQALLFMVINIPLLTKAEVNMKDAGFLKSWTDLLHTSKTPIKLNRRYNSRSLHNGYFGFGWCSDFEKSLRAPDSERLILRQCNTDTDLVYRTLNTRKPAQQGKLYIQENNPSDVIEYKNGLYIRKASDGGLQKFDRGGQLIGYALKAERWIEVIRDESGLPKKFRAKDGAELNFVSDSRTRKVIRVEGKTLLEFQYAGTNLVRVQKNKKPFQLFQYDSTQNLTRIEDDLGHAIQITYDQDKDWVSEIRDNKCIEVYRFLAAPIDGDNHFVSSIKRTCNDVVDKQATFEFWHKTRSDGVRYLERLRIQDNRKVHQINYDPYTGGAHVME